MDQLPIGNCYRHSSQNIFIIVFYSTQKQLTINKASYINSLFFLVYNTIRQMLLQNNTVRSSIFQGFQILEKAQTKRQQYLQLYKQHLAKTLEINQFLNADEINQEKEIMLEQKNEVKQTKTMDNSQITVFPSKQNVQSSHLRQVDINKIFQDIVIRAQNDAQTKVKVSIEGKLTDLKFEKHNDFSLSNFSSFNNGQQIDDFPFNFNELLQKIQETHGKMLSSKGIEKIINQIQQIVSQIQQNNEQIKDNCLSNLSQSSLFFNQIETSHIKEKPIDSNSKLFYKKKDRRQEKGFSRRNIDQKQNFQQVLEYKRSQDKKWNKSKDKRKMLNRSKNEINSLPTLFNSKSSDKQRQLRIIRKNNVKNTLILQWLEAKDVQNFCILNKIYGKQRQKIFRAIESGKTVLNLQ